MGKKYNLSQIILLFSVLIIGGCNSAKEPKPTNPSPSLPANPNSVSNPSAVSPLTGTPPFETDCNNREGNCVCSIEVNKILDGYSYNMNLLTLNADGISGEQTFLYGLSENIPVICQTGIYLVQHNKSWFLDYFRAQKQSHIGFSGNELFSPTYMPQTAGYILTVLNHAIQRGDTDLEQAAAEWLKTYWAYLALAASTTRPTTFSYTFQSGIVSGPTYAGIRGGYGLSIVGTRVYTDGMKATGLQDIFLDIALEHPARHYTWNLNSSPGAYGGLRAFIRSIGYTVPVSNGVVSLQSRGIPARNVGLTDDQRSILNQFIQSNGTQRLNDVLNLVRPYKLSCDLSFIRTTEGLMTWFGTSDKRTPLCSGSKGGPYSAMSMKPSQGTGEVLQRVKIENRPDPGEIWRSGNQICSNSTKLPTACINIPQGQMIYEVAIDKALGTIRCIQGTSCGSQPNSTPPPPAATPTPPPPPPSGGSNANPGPGPAPIPRAGAQATCGVDALCLLNRRYKLTASYLNQFSNTSGQARAINNTDVSGFFHFGDASNIELIVKVLNFGGSIKVFYGQLTNLKFNLAVYDTVTGTTRTYQNTNGDCGGIDQNAFVAVNLKTQKSKKIAAVKKSNRDIASASCVPNANTLCLQNNRIRVTANWQNQYNNTSGTATTRSLSSVTGGLYFTDISNLELLIKAVDFGNHYLISYGALSDLGYSIDVTDTVTGRTRTFVNPTGNYCGRMDSSSFPK